MREGMRRNQAQWLQGGRGEQELGRALGRLRDEGLAVLHDRRIPNSRANIDHLVIGPAGVFVIDTKLYTGKIERRYRGRLLSRDSRLYVQGRDRTNLVDGMARQVEAVRGALASTNHPKCAVIAAICFVESRWGLWGAPFAIGNVRVVWPRMLGKLIRNEGPLGRDDIASLEHALGVALPPA